jgi:inner membrane protein
MASIGHVAVGMAAARLYRRGQPTQFALLTSMVLWSALSLLPDADVVGMRFFGVEYGDPWGHRGATHSLAFALLLGVAIGAASRFAGVRPVRTAVTAVLVLASHPLLDTLTDGGLGCALLWPFSDARFFAPWNPIPVAPIGRAFFTTAWGWRVAATELAMFAPLIAYAVWPRRARPRWA